MEKINLMSKQLFFMHKELRKVKDFFKSSSKHFIDFHHSMSKSLNSINQGDLFNDIHYMNYTNITIIECFTKKIRTQADEYAKIHSFLKEEGNKVKDIEKDLEKLIKNAASKKEDLLQSNDLEGELKVISDCICQMRESIKHSFDTFINQLCTFADTKETLKTLLEQGEKSYNDTSPIISRKLNAIKGRCVLPVKDYPMRSEEKSKPEQPQFNMSQIADLEKKKEHFFSTEKKARSRVYQDASINKENPEKDPYDLDDQKIFKRMSTNVLMLSPNMYEMQSNYHRNSAYTGIPIKSHQNLVEIAQGDQESCSDDDQRGGRYN